MRKLRFVGDGERDAVTVPKLVLGILRADFEHMASPWPRLHRGEKKIRGYDLKGHGLKLAYVLTEARQSGFHGVVATVDTDRSERGERLRQLKTAREADRSKFAPLPTALGEATPHNEAWLLDDPVAVRQGLNLPANAGIPDVRGCSYPKSALEELHRDSPRAAEPPLNVWPDIAAQVDAVRCTHKQDTGFEAFIAEVEAELRQLFTLTN
jgi:hypothetical protein